MVFAQSVPDLTDFDHASQDLRGQSARKEQMKKQKEEQMESQPGVLLKLVLIGGPLKLTEPDEANGREPKKP
jgi:hypothetical protein